MIPRETFDRFDTSLQTAATLAENAVVELMSNTVGMTDTQTQAYLLQQYPTLVKAYGNLAAAAAVEYYNDLRATYDLDSDYTATIPEINKHYQAIGDVNRTLEEADDITQAQSSLSALSGRRVMEYADDTFTDNALRDPAHPRWALIPHAGACAWCLLIGSNGFVYSEDGVLASRHTHCKCTPTVDFGNSPGVQGFNQKKLQHYYSTARASVEDEARTQWAAMSPEERKKYTRTRTTRDGRKVGGNTPSYDAYLRNKIVSRMAKQLHVEEHKH
jgi:hypothetical protein